MKLNEFDDMRSGFEPAAAQLPRCLRSATAVSALPLGTVGVRAMGVFNLCFCLVIVECHGIGMPDAQSWWAELREHRAAVLQD